MPTRPPRNLDAYTDAAQAAAGLEQIAADIRAKARIHPLVRWNLNLSFWNPAWAAPMKPGSIRKVGEKAENLAPHQGSHGTGGFDARWSNV